ncbi:aminopeptidase [Halogeometricum pallidum JCM 14848]|uniref:Carboxypeptidase Q n=1 Tax=Halogeometricum pallidum JCM 14848 TaxID=1227487 RepID=M0DH33_HALPD|nr:M28 family metallopeptidase [Halogeometricum pallidum]ELZ34002.1 aminopeptidase [Halogeometricum pallidum JCM 14848]
MDDHDETARDAALGRTWTDDEPWEFLTRLTRLGDRMGGSEGERRAAELVADAFRDAGVRDVREESFEMQAWTRGSSALAVTTEDREFETVALPYSPSGDVTGELVDVGHGTPDEVDERDVAGKIAVASTTTPPGGRFVHRMEKFSYAVERGAEAFVFVNHVPGQLPPTGSLKFDGEAAAPAVGVSKESGGWLTDYAEESAEARLTVEAETADGESRNVVGRLGPDTDEEVVLLAHYDAHDIAEGALDNGCGITTVVTAARILAELDLPVGVRVAGVGCEETGLTGAEHLASDLDRDRIKAVVNVDGAGRFRDLVAMAHTSEATADVARTVADETRHPIQVQSEPHPFSDQWPFVRAGVPALQLHSDSGERGRGWGHTHADTRDKVDDRNIREHAMLAALLVEELAGRDFEKLPRLDADELADAFRAADFETGMRAADLWPAEWE